jgi:molecular chaperone DnaK (HSP70)
MRLIAICTILLVVVTVVSAQTTSTGQRSLVVVEVEANSPVLWRAQLTEPIGIETLGGVFTSILAAGCALPCEVTNTFSTAEDKQTEIKIVYRATGQVGVLRAWA